MNYLVITSGPLLAASFRALVLGILLGAVYDCFVIIRTALGAGDQPRFPYCEKVYGKRIKKVFRPIHGKAFRVILTAVFDFVFALCAACAFSVFLFACNSGIFRWFLLAASCLGFRLYRVSVGKAVRKAAFVISDTVLLCLNFAVSIVIIPFELAFVLLKPMINKIIQVFASKILLAIDRTVYKRYTVNKKKSLCDTVRFDF